mmetsp:Transcript_24446/g.65645  ORF Transcript_24446/g.65645 Transcript_24446/m.65645 type:complete len:138 (+) Transcript_24446:322-735(+)|eukprot:469460-Prymnesium_polylepis.2
MHLSSDIREARSVLCSQFGLPLLTSRVQIRPPFVCIWRVRAVKETRERFLGEEVSELLATEQMDAGVELAGQYLANGLEDDSRDEGDIDEDHSIDPDRIALDIQFGHRKLGGRGHVAVSHTVAIADDCHPAPHVCKR